MGWFDVSTLKEPYRIEGKKTMGIELLEQLGWEVPDVILYPTGGGTGLIGMWKAFDELEALGWIGPERPRMIAVQAAGCAPIVKAFEDGERHATRWEGAHTIAMGIRVPVAVGDFLILDAVRESGGTAIAVEDDHIERCATEVASRDGLLLCPEGAATVAAWEVGLERGDISRDDRVVLFNCGNGLKYPMPPADRVLATPVDWERMAGRGRGGARVSEAEPRPRSSSASSSHRRGIARLSRAVELVADATLVADRAAAARGGRRRGRADRARPHAGRRRAARCGAAPAHRRTAGVGTDNLDLEALEARGVKVHLATGANAISVAEHVIGALLFLSRPSFAPPSGSSPASGHAPSSSAVSSPVARSGLLGFGATARAVAHRPPRSAWRSGRPTRWSPTRDRA
jgi:hypothetical protein